MSYEGTPVETNLSSSSSSSHSASSSSAKLVDYIKIYDNAIPNELCDKLVKHLDETGSKHYVDQDYLRRIESSFYPSSNTGVFTELLNNLKSMYNQYKEDLGPIRNNLYQANKLEYPVLVAYKPNPEKKELFHDHADAWHFDSCSRQISVIYYLSEVEEGGHTTFTHLDLSIKPVKGRALFFPSNFMYKHRAEPPIIGTKYICVCWLHFDGNTVYGTMKF